MDIDPDDKKNANAQVPYYAYQPNSNGQGAFKRGPRRTTKSELPSSVSFLLNAANQLNPSAEIEQNHPDASTFIKSASLNKSDSDSLSDEVNSDPTSIDKRKRGGDDTDKERKKKVRLLKNRQSAALSRQRKKEYISTIEQKCNTLMVENSDLQNQIKSFSTNTWQNKVENEQLENQLKELTKQNEELRRANDLLLKANEVMLKSAQLNYQNNSATLQFVAANTPHQLLFGSAPSQAQKGSGSATSSNPHPNSLGNANNNTTQAAPVQGHFLLNAAALNVVQSSGSAANNNGINVSLVGGAQLTPQQLQGLGGLLILHQSTNNNININNNSDTTNFVTNNNVQLDPRRNSSENISEDKKAPSPTIEAMKVDQSSSEASNGSSQATPMIISEGQ